MKLAKIFDSVELGSNNLFDIFYNMNIDYFIEDGMTEYCVNSFINEYDGEDEKGKKSYNLKEVENAKKLDNFFISNGANKDEIIFVYHGTFNSKPWYKK